MLVWCWPLFRRQVRRWIVLLMHVWLCPLYLLSTYQEQDVEVPCLFDFPAIPKPCINPSINALLKGPWGVLAWPGVGSRVYPKGPSTPKSYTLPKTKLHNCYPNPKSLIPKDPIIGSFGPLGFRVGGLGEVPWRVSLHVEVTQS